MRPEPCWLRERLWSSYYFLGVGKATAMVSHDKGPLTPVALTEANLEARDFRLDYAAKVLDAFQKRKAAAEETHEARNARLEHEAKIFLARARGFGPTHKMVQTATGRVLIPCDPVLPDCPHGEYTWNCAECGGTGKCIHNKESCEECGYSHKCIHKHRRYLCKECKGHGICQHNRQSYYCKDCKGGGICEHDKRKSYCKECKSIPNEICEHNTVKRCCKYCNR
jgi:hypothetical protein